MWKEIDGMEIRNEEDLKRLQEFLKGLKGEVRFYIDVWNFRARLMKETVIDDKGHTKVEELNLEKLGLTEDDLEDMVYKAGGAMNMSGQYDVLDDELLAKLEE